MQNIESNDAIRARSGRSGSLHNSNVPNSTVVPQASKFHQLNISTGGTLVFPNAIANQIPKTPQPIIKKRNLGTDATVTSQATREKTPESNEEHQVERVLFLSESESDVESDANEEQKAKGNQTPTDDSAKHRRNTSSGMMQLRITTASPGSSSGRNGSAKKRLFLDSGGTPPNAAAMPGNTSRVMRQNYHQKMLSNHRRQSIIQRAGAHKRSQSDFTAEMWDSTLSGAKSAVLGVPTKPALAPLQSDKSNVTAGSNDAQKLKQIRKHQLIVITDDATTDDNSSESDRERTSSEFQRTSSEFQRNVSPTASRAQNANNLTLHAPTSAHRRQDSTTSISSTISVATNASVSNTPRQVPRSEKKHSASNSNLRLASGPSNINDATMKLISSSTNPHGRISNSSHNSPESLYASALFRWSDLTTDERDKQSSSFSPPGARVDLRDYRRDMYLEQMPQKYLMDVSMFDDAQGDRKTMPEPHSEGDESDTGSTTLHTRTSSHDDFIKSPPASPPKTVGIKRKSLELVRNQFAEFKQRQKEKLKQKRSQIKFIEVYVFVPHQKNSGVHRVKIRLEHSAKTNGNVLIEAAIQQYRIETGQEPIHSQPDGYLLKAAMNDGSVDSDWPPISKKTAIATLGCKFFVLVVDKTFNRFQRRSLNETDFESMQTNPSCQAKKTLLKVDSETGALSVSSLPKCLSDIRFKVLMSDADSAHSSLYTVPIAPDVLIKDILAVIESRLNLEKGVYDIQLMKENGARTMIPAHLRYRTARFLEVETVALLRKFKKVTPSRKAQSMSETFEFAIPNTSIDYTEYRVIKINKYGMRQERILGIDSQYLYNKLPKAKNKTKKFLENTVNMLQRHRRQVERPVTTLQKTTRSTKNPLAFTTLFQNGEMLYWEAKTKIEAEEIVNTLNYLQRVHQSSYFKNPLSVTPVSMTLT